MISKEEAIRIAKEYINERKRSYLYVKEEKTYLETSEVLYGEKDLGEEHDMWIVSYEVESWDVPIPHFVHIKAETGEVYYTMTQHGYVEDWEEDEHGNLIDEEETE